MPDLLTAQVAPPHSSSFQPGEAWRHMPPSRGSCSLRLLGQVYYERLVLSGSSLVLIRLQQERCLRRMP